MLQTPEKERERTSARGEKKRKKETVNEQKRSYES
jgi:hypothetical protein